MITRGSGPDAGELLGGISGSKMGQMKYKQQYLKTGIAETSKSDGRM